MPILNREEIEQCIPHRSPFLWIDEVTQWSDRGLRARKHLDPELGVFGGHFPNHPVLPGVLLCEMALQAAAVWLSKTGAFENGRLPVATRMGDVKFRRMVRPGETVDVDVELTERLANAYFLKGKITVDGETAARLEFACAAVEVD